MESALNLSQLLGLKDVVTEFSALGDDYIFTHITNNMTGRLHENAPFRVDGLTWILCLKGSIDISLNLSPLHLTENSIMITGPDSIMAFDNIDREHLDCYVLFISTAFMKDTNMDPNVVASIPVHSPRQSTPVMQITSEESDLLMRYFKLVHHNTSSNPDNLYVRSISRCLVAALCYQVIQFASLRLQAMQGVETMHPHSRRTTHVHEFMSLVHRHHRRERSVAFYASQLFISPKYLSLIIKEATGRSAAQWIDEFVILEAKNLLRFSGKNIQQVAYDLNFPNQSSFGKYFKHLTGMAPSQYQRS